MYALKIKAPSGLFPKTNLGLFTFIFAPGAWVFMSNHSEALFLILSWASLYLALQKAGWKTFVLASLLGGCAALTRNQGVVLSLVIAYALASRDDTHSLFKKIRLFTYSGLISGSLFGLWPLFQWWTTSNPCLSIQAQAHWHMVKSFNHFVSNFFWVSRSHFLRRGLFWGLLVSGFVFLRKKELRVIGIYILLSAMLWPLQGNNYAQAYRFSSVLFPFWFLLGDKISELIEKRFKDSKQQALILKSVYVSALISWSFFISYSYFSGSKVFWPY
jgi:hypothetical protein